MLACTVTASVLILPYNRVRVLPVPVKVAVPLVTDQFTVPVNTPAGVAVNVILAGVFVPAFVI